MLYSASYFTMYWVPYGLSLVYSYNYIHGNYDMSFALHCFEKIACVELYYSISFPILRNSAMSSFSFLKNLRSFPSTIFAVLALGYVRLYGNTSGILLLCFLLFLEGAFLCPKS